MLRPYYLYMLSLETQPRNHRRHHGLKHRYHRHCVDLKPFRHHERQRFRTAFKAGELFAHRGAHRHHSHHVHQEQQEKGHRLRMCRLRHFDDRHDHDERRGKTACGLAAV